MPKLDRVLETALYVDDVERAARSYADVLRLRPLFADARLRAFAVGGVNVLPLFRRGASLETTRMPGGTIPPHDGSGPLHVAFGIASAELPAWQARLRAQNIAIEGRTDSPRGRPSTYSPTPPRHPPYLPPPPLAATPLPPRP